MIVASVSLHELAEQWLGVMGRASLYGGIVLGLVWVACRCFPRLPARWRCWLWRLAFLKLLLCVAFTSTLDVPLLPSFFGSVSAGGVARDLVGAPAARPVDLALPQDAADGLPRMPGSSGTFAAEPLRPTTASAGSVAPLILLGLWTVAVLGLIGLIGARIVAAQRWRRECVLIKDPEILALGERLARQFGLVQPPLLLRAGFCGSPVVLGAVRTAIVLPETIVEKVTPSEMRLILAHEMAHIRRGDLLSNWFVSIVSGLFFFHPLAWLAFRENRLAQETACDELALGLSGGSVVDYGNLIVDLAARCCRPTSALVAVGVVESFQKLLKRRLRAMKDFGTESVRVVALSWFLAAVAVVGLLPWRVVAMSVAADDPETAEAVEVDEEAVVDPFAPVRATAGKYTITVDGVRPASGRMTMESSGFPMIPDKTSRDSHQVTRSGRSAHGSWSTSASGGSAGMGGGFAGSFTTPNLILDVKVEPSKPGRAKGTCLLCAVNGKVKAVDDQGNEFDSPGTPAMLRHRFVDMEYPEGSGRTAIHLYRPQNAGNYLRSLDGEIHVVEAKQRQFDFTGKELLRKTSKHQGDTTVELTKFKKTSEGIDVSLAASPPPSKKSQDPFERMQLSFMARNRVQVTLEDTEGEIYRPTQTESNSAGESSWNGGNRSGSSSWGSSGKSISRSWSGGSSGGSTSGGSRSFSGGSSVANSEPGAIFHFDPLPEGVKVRAVHCTITDLLDKPKAVPFHLEGIPLP